MEPMQDSPSAGLDSMTRRRLLKGAGAFALTATGGSLLSACGGSSSGSSSAASPLKNGQVTGGVPASQLRSLLGISDADVKNLKGKTWNLGLIVALTGSGAEYGRSQGNGFKLAAAHIQQITGMKVNTQTVDNQSGTPAAGVSAVRQFGGSGFGAVLSSYNGDEGAELPGLKQYKIMSFDPGGGTSVFFEGVPYFWGFRANTPNDPWPGNYKYIASALPKAKRVAFLVWDLGGAFVAKIANGLPPILAQHGMQLVGTQTAAIGATDYSGVISKLKDLSPDLIQTGLWGTDPGYFMKQYANSGIGAPVVGSEFTHDAANAAGTAYDKYWFATDYFDFAKPPNPLSQVFVKGYQAMFGAPANLFYEPNYYEGTLGMFELARRVAAKGGDINSGEQLQNAVVQNPTFKSVYGGDSSTVGTVVLDTAKHTPIKRSMGTFAVQNGTPTPLALYNIGGADFKVIKKGA
jgi:branched-chain amino acid transport system substrate-binding protein